MVPGGQHWQAAPNAELAGTTAGRGAGGRRADRATGHGWGEQVLPGDGSAGMLPPGDAARGMGTGSLGGGHLPDQLPPGTCRIQP